MDEKPMTQERLAALRIRLLQIPRMREPRMEIARKIKCSLRFLLLRAVVGAGSLIAGTGRTVFGTFFWVVWVG